MLINRLEEIHQQHNHILTETLIQMTQFIPGGHPEENGRIWQRWKKEFQTRLRYFRIDAVADMVDAINIYGGERVRELIELLPNRPNPENVNRTAFDEIICKLDHHFKPQVNSDGARARLDKLQQLDTETMAQYYVRIKQIASDCNFPDPDDAIRSKILHTMRDDRLRREAMIKSYTLQELLTHAANKEDVDREAKQIEGEKSAINKVHAKNQYPRRSPSTKPSTQWKQQKQPTQQGKPQQQPQQ